MITITGPNGHQRDTRCVFNHSSVGHYFNWNFSSAAFQMAMKRYKQDLECTNLLNLLPFNPPPWNPDTFAKTSDMRDASQNRPDCRIIQGHMLHCTQVAIPSLTPETSYKFTKNTTEYICPHITLATSFTDPHTAYVVRVDPICPPYPSSKDYNPIWKARLGYFTAPARDVTSKGLLTCQPCYTECQIEYKHYPIQGIMLFVTK
ncbi:uncharacterized protein PAC_03661 [Phialocephala subalpina]|uniref:Uncharacterized protein n=1 Tax=Phialocephala subalpina TaxID=576137 RepID=A0A1L7WLZ7_9HELO|nr:uncharacterized protein PAC_03661 [Phialocephala subalpina]